MVCLFLHELIAPRLQYKVKSTDRAVLRVRSLLLLHDVSRHSSQKFVSCSQYLRLHLGLASFVFIQVATPKLCMHFFSLLFILYVLPISSPVILSPKQHLVMLLRRPKLSVNLLKTKRNLLCIRNQPVPRNKHFPPRL